MPVHRKPRCTARQFREYAIGVLPGAAAMNFFSTILACTVVLPHARLSPEVLIPAILAGQIVGFSMLFACLLMRWIREFQLGLYSHAFAWNLLVASPCGFFAARVIVRTLLDRDTLQMSPDITHEASLLALGIIAVFGNYYYSVRWRLAKESWRADDSARAAAEARLRALQAYVEPHFLFNALANVSALINQSPDKARQLLNHLNHYFATSVMQGRCKVSRLKIEFSLLEAYLNIMAIRMPDRLRIHVHCSPDCADLPFPPLLLHPLVENAVVHGIEPATRQGSISLHASRSGRDLFIRVRDNGVGVGQAQPKPGSNGTGINNVRERLQALFGSAATLQITQAPQGGTDVLLSLSISSLMTLVTTQPNELLAEAA